MKSKRLCNGFSLIEMLVVVAVLIVVVLFYPVNKQTSCGPRPLCSNNLQQISLALMQYNQDYNQHLPLVGYAKTPKDNQLGWCNALFPYLKNHDIYKCPQGFAQYIGRTDYWLNSNLSGIHTRKISSPEVIISFGDGNDTRTQTTSSYNLNSLPPYWLNDLKSPAYRHKGMANYLFLDGHVKALTPDKITCEPTGNGKPTFAVK